MNDIWLIFVHKSLIWNEVICIYVLFIHEMCVYVRELFLFYFLSLIAFLIVLIFCSDKLINSIKMWNKFNNEIDI